MNFLVNSFNFNQSWKLSSLGLPKEQEAKKTQHHTGSFMNFSVNSLNFNQNWKLSPLGLPMEQEAKKNHTGSFMNFSVNSHQSWQKLKVKLHRLISGTKGQKTNTSLREMWHTGHILLRLAFFFNIFFHIFPHRYGERGSLENYIWIIWINITLDKKLT